MVDVRKARHEASPVRHRWHQAVVEPRTKAPMKSDGSSFAAAAAGLVHRAKWPGPCWFASQTRAGGGGRIRRRRRGERRGEGAKWRT